MKPKEFIDKYYYHAEVVSSKTGIPAISIMAQAALESGWGSKSIGKNIFGIKFKKGDCGYQEVLTTEYSSNPRKFDGQNVKSKTYDRKSGKYKFKVWQYFADYKTYEDSFLAHSRLLLSERYKYSLRWSYSPKRYLISIWRCGYATDPNYGRKMCDMVDSINRRL